MTRRRAGFLTGFPSWRWVKRNKYFVGAATIIIYIWWRKRQRLRGVPLVREIPPEHAQIRSDWGQALRDANRGAAAIGDPGAYEDEMLFYDTPEVDAGYDQVWTGSPEERPMTDAELEAWVESALW